MTSEKQILANRTNSKKSTGPKTENGKRVVGRNATRHGLLARDIVLKGENFSVYKEIAQQIREVFNPSGVLEQMIVENLINLKWKLGRIQKIENGVFSKEFYELEEEAIERTLGRWENQTLNQLASQIQFDPKLQDNEDYQRTKMKLDDLVESQAEDENLRMAAAFSKDANGMALLEKVARYDVYLTNQFFRFLHELERLQARRKAEEKAKAQTPAHPDCESPNFP